MIDIKIISALSLCSLAAVAGVGAIKTETDYKIIVNYNGQADLLLSLQIPPDYYPYQFKKTTLYDYLTHTNRYIVANEKVSEGKRKIKNNLQKRINELLGKVREFGPSLWNKDLYDTGIVFRNDQFWNSKKTAIMFIEQFISDDYKNIIDSYNLLPAHKNLIVTNYRAARDPYTIFKKEIFDCFKKNQNCSDEIGKKFKKYIDNYQLVDINSLYRFGKYMEFWNNLLETSKNQLDKLNFENLLKEENLFSLIKEDDAILFKKYKQTLFTEEENEEIKKWESNWRMNYESKNKFKLSHHPALEQQILPGTAPLAEGSQKDIIIFLYQFAALIDQYTKTSNFETEFKDDYRREYMKKSLENSQKMSNNISERIKNIREYFKKIKVVDDKFDPEKGNYTITNSKTFTVLTYPPTSFGAGDATIQSMSKFPFIYQDIGLKQPIPNDLSDDNHVHDDNNLENWSFSVDDNGWWWKIGNVNLDPSNMIKFSNTTDTLLLLANEDDWNLLNDVNSNTLKATGILLKTEDKIINPKKINRPGYEVSYNKYHLWNEGLRSPIALNLLLDNLVDIFQKQYDTNWTNRSDEEYKKAMDWGDYWSDCFLENKNSNI